MGLTSRLLLFLTAGVLISAVAVFALVGLVGTQARRFGPESAWDVTLVAVLAVFLVVETRVTPLSFTGLRRQTPKWWRGGAGPRIRALLWGLDVGTLVSTYRVSTASWAALALAFFGWGAGVGGVGYALGFCVPVALVVLAHLRDWRSDLLRASRDTVEVVGDLIAAAPRIRTINFFLLLPILVASFILAL